MRGMLTRLSARTLPTKQFRCLLHGNVPSERADASQTIARQTTSLRFLVDDASIAAGKFVYVSVGSVSALQGVHFSYPGQVSALQGVPARTKPEYKRDNINAHTWVLRIEVPLAKQIRVCRRPNVPLAKQIAVGQANMDLRQ